MKNERFLRGQESRNRDVVRVRPDQLALPPVRHVHAGLLVITLIMVCFGLVMLFSASMTDAYSSEGNALFYVLKQGSITTMGLILALFTDPFNSSTLIFGDGRKTTGGSWSMPYSRLRRDGYRQEDQHHRTCQC